MSGLTDALRRTSATSDRRYVAGFGGEVNISTWREVHEDARAVAGGLSERGIGRGDVLAVLVADPAALAPLLQAAWMLGAAVTMLHQPTPRTDMAAWTDDVNAACRAVSASTLIVDDLLEAAIQDAASTVLPLTRFAGLRSEPLSATVAVPGSEAALLQLTSGSTGTPKAVVVTHDALLANITATATAMDVRPERDVMVSWLPLFHDMGMIGFLAAPMILGIPAVKLTPADFMARPAVWPETIATYAGTVTAAPNFAYGILARTLERAPEGQFDLSALRCAINGAEPINPETIDRLIAAGARHGLRAGAMMPAYGLAEATLSVSMAGPGTGMEVDHIDPQGLEIEGTAQPSTAADARALPILGHPLPGISLRIADDLGRELPPRRIGDVAIQGSSVAESYRDAAGTISARSADGWLDTGDRGYRLPDGRLVICGRRKDLIIIGGRNIYPTDIERAVGSLDGVRTGNAVAVPISHRNGTEGFAIVLESHGHSDELYCRSLEEAVIARTIEIVGAVPALVRVVQPGSIPKTTSGKLKRGVAAAFLVNESARAKAIRS
ncbi:long-chain-fatty-acid--CoA ligase [Nocardia niigatensis]